VCVFWHRVDSLFVRLSIRKAYTKRRAEKGKDRAKVNEEGKMDENQGRRK